MTDPKEREYRQMATAIRARGDLTLLIAFLRDLYKNREDKLRTAIRKRTPPSAEGWGTFQYLQGECQALKDAINLLVEYAKTDKEREPLPVARPAD